MNKIIEKITNGYVVQTYDAKTGKFLYQSDFIAGDTCYFEDGGGHRVYPLNKIGFKMYHPFPEGTKFKK